MTAYQPVLDGKGKVVAAGERDCDDRWQAIAAEFHRLSGLPFTLLDVGAYTGYFSRRATAEYACRAFAVDDNPKLQPAPNVRVHRGRVDAGWIARQPRFDVILALSVLHHMPDWRDVLRELQACRGFAVVEVPAPNEWRWMTSAPARRDVPEIAETVAAAAGVSGGKLLGEFPRTGKDGITYQRRMWLLPGRVQQVTGRVFTGSGSASRTLPRYVDRLAGVLGYKPYPGTLNLRGEEPFDFGSPTVEHVDSRRRGKWAGTYRMWRAWHSTLADPVHVMVDRGHGPDALEVIAAPRLRDHWAVHDGDVVTLDVERGR